ncbi:Ig-like domain-containing protein [Candidatus Palauibacter sp.]|uniref:Ig-like domain-containing protein n=1 Tax=Candidatus Palauibacter sp. TaxID=3101350 RepID=UPI003B5933AB
MERLAWGTPVGRGLLVVAVLSATLWAYACGDGATEPPTPPPDPLRPTSVMVTPATAQLGAMGATVQLIAEVRDQNGQAMAGAAVTWASGSAAVATVSGSGLVTAAGNGTATITATAGSASGTATVTVAQSANQDRGALVALYEATNGSNWVNNDNWLTDTPLGDWYGVTVDGSGRVLGIDLSGQWDSENSVWIRHGLSGLIPPEIGSLSNVRWLRLSENALFGPIPRELGGLAGLRELELAGNDLADAIPPELGGLSSLRVLDLGANRLSGSIPAELGGLTNLTRLALYANSLTGSIPPELGKLVNLEDMRLFINSLDGPVPAELGQLVRLAWLLLSYNNLTGPIPPEWGNLRNLSSLALRNNRLSGPIPPSFVQLDNLDRFYSSGNALLCVPGTSAFATWLLGIRERDTGAVSSCDATDRAVLGSLYEASAGDAWINATGWLRGRPLEDWYGVDTDSIGRVETLDLSRNGLSGRLPANLGDLAHMTTLRMDGNALSGRLPASLTQLPLRELHYAETGLCAPVEHAFRHWINRIASHEGTGLECEPQSARNILERLYEAGDGPNWNHDENWLADEPLGEWYGVEVDGQGRVVSLSLQFNNLTGAIPPELGSLSSLTKLSLVGNNLTGLIPLALGSLAELTILSLEGNALSGQIPAEIGNLGNLRHLWLSYNTLSGPIPPELGDLSSLATLELSGNALSGPIPPELGDLGNLVRLDLRRNELTGPIPPELGNFRGLRTLRVDGNRLTGPIPPELGGLGNLVRLDLRRNELTGPIPPELGGLGNLIRLDLGWNSLNGPIPPELGKLSALQQLFLDNNDLSGPVLSEFGRLADLQQLNLANNPKMAGVLPPELTALGGLNELLAGGTSLCAPSDPDFQTWLDGVDKRWIASCVEANGSLAYLTQAVQSEGFPVPLVAGEKALLRVFPVANRTSSQGIPAVRARFYRDGREVHLEDIPGKSTPIPTEVDEGDLAKSANAEIPGREIQPGLEMVIEIDPEGTLDPGLGVAQRIPETGRLVVDIRTMPLLDLTLIPFIWSQHHDSTVVDWVEEMAADPENHELMRGAFAVLPVGDLAVKAHEPVLTTTNDRFRLLHETETIRVMEGANGHYMGMIESAVAQGVSSQPGRSSFVELQEGLGGPIAHELGHNFNLGHAPCGNAPGPDAGFPYPGGTIGAWGYDFRGGGSLIHPFRPDLMSYCGGWISDYHFTNALRFRLVDEGPSESAAFAPSTTSLLLWGGVDADSVPFLEPTFVVDAPPELPRSGGAYQLTGRTEGGVELFSLRFDMPSLADGDGRSSFVFVVPVRPGWEGNLASITLSGPGGSATLDGESDRFMAILRDPGNGQVRGILRDAPTPTQAAMDAALDAAGPGLEVLFSRGIPDAAAWRR